MLNKRFIKKTVAMVCTLTITFVTLGTVFMPYDVKASENKELNSASDSTDTAYFNDKYMTLTDEKNICGAIGYGDDIVLISNGKKSYDYETGNYDDNYKLTSDSEFRFADENGVYKVLKNKDDNGNQKYDIISGTLTGASYTYLKVVKDGKPGLIDINGNDVAIGSNGNYDKINMYTSYDGKIFYALFNKSDEKSYNIELVDENGESVFQLSNTKSIGFAEKKYFYLYNDNIGYIIDTTGKIIYSQEASDISSVSNNGFYPKTGERRRAICFGTKNNNEYTYYFLDTGMTMKTNGSMKYIYNSNGFGPYYTIGDGKFTEYDIDFNEVRSIETDFTGYVSTYVINNGNGDSRLVLCSNGDYNIYDKEGNWLFEHKIEINGGCSEFYTSGIVVKDDIDNAKYILYDGGKKKIDFNKVKSIADNKLSETAGSEADIDDYKCNINEYGITFKYNNETILVTYDSDYANAVRIPKIEEDSQYIISDNEVVKSGDNFCHIFEKVEKNITDEYGTVRECKYCLARTYYIDYETYSVKMITQNNDYFTDNIGKWSTVYIYDKYGIIYGVDEDGTILKKYISDAETRKFVFPGSNKVGYYSNIRIYPGDVVASKMKIVDGDNVIFEDEGYSYSYPSDDLLAYGYMHRGQSVITYNGEQAVDALNSIDVYHGKNFVYVLLDKSKLLKVKNILTNNKLEDILQDDSILTISQTDKLESKIVTGVEENVSAADVKNVFNNASVRIVDCNNIELNNTDVVGTGCKIQIVNDSDIIDSATVVIKGDTDGSGTIDVLDIETIQKSILGVGEELSGAYKEAALLSDADEVSVFDIEAVQKNILGIEMINQH